jgi:hypothetical protein
MLVPVTTAWRVLRLQMEERPPIWRVAVNVGPCYHGMARPQVADGGTASYMEGSCECESLSPRNGASSGCGWRNRLLDGGEL